VPAGVWALFGRAFDIPGSFAELSGRFAPKTTLAGSFCTSSNGLSVPAQPALALLHEVSAIDVAFFDEPTANLDDHRRDNLAEQILNVKGFSQLFVISHDDTFERDTDHVVRVVKENGVSRVLEA
jgi:exonuclease SbcC